MKTAMSALLAPNPERSVERREPEQNKPMGHPEDPAVEPRPPTPEIEQVEVVELEISDTESEDSQATMPYAPDAEMEVLDSSDDEDDEVPEVIELEEPMSPHGLALERDVEDGPVVSLERLHRRALEMIAPTEEQVQDLCEYFAELMYLCDLRVVRAADETERGTFRSGWMIDMEPAFYHEATYHNRTLLELNMLLLGIQAVLGAIRLRAWDGV